jgi:hypothetical protein
MKKKKKKKKGKKDIIVLYKDGDIDFKSANKFVPLTYDELDLIKLFLIPIKIKKYSIYFPVTPSKLLYGKKFRIRSKLEIIEVDYEEESVYPSTLDSFNYDITYDNVYDFLSNLYVMYIFEGFNEKLEEALILDATTFINQYHIYDLCIDIYNNMNDKIATIKAKNPLADYSSVLMKGTDIINADIIENIMVFIPYLHDNFSMKFKDSESICIDYDGWESLPVRKYVKSSYNLSFIPISGYNYYYLINKEEYFNLENIYKKKVSYFDIIIINDLADLDNEYIKYLKVPNNVLDDEDEYLEYLEMAKNKIAYGLSEEGSIEYFDIISYSFYNTRDYLAYMPFMSVLSLLIDFMYGKLYIEDYEIGDNNTFIRTYSSKKSNYNYYYGFETDSDKFINDITKLIK